VTTIEGQLGCFQVSTIMTKAAINVYVVVLFCFVLFCGHEFSIQLGKYQGE
jgi:hypothetical protein